MSIGWCSSGPRAPFMASSAGSRPPAPGRPTGRLAAAPRCGHRPTSSARPAPRTPLRAWPATSSPTPCARAWWKPSATTPSGTPSGCPPARPSSCRSGARAATSAIPGRGASAAPTGRWSRRERRSYNRGMSEFIVGLTGGVASGKSEVQRRFEALGVFVADADVAARNAVAKGSDGLREAVEAFGAGVLDAGGELDRAAMRRRIFQDAEAKRQLEAIIHPRVRIELYEACRAAPTPYAMAAIPLLAESGGRAAYPWLDRIVVVDADPEVQLSRLRARDGIGEELASRMLAS